MVRAVHNQPVYFGAGGCHHEKGRAWSVADILRRERNEPEIHGAVPRKLADNLEQARAEAAREAPR